MKLLFAVNTWGIGGSFGFSLHILKMRQALAALGVEIITDPSEPYDIAVSIIRPDFFRVLPGKPHLFFSACEFSEPTVLPSEDAKQAAAMLVPCRHNRDVFSRYFAGDVHVVQEGVDVDRFPYVERRAPADDEFRVLFNGNLDDGRKGGGHAISAWRAWAASGRMPRSAELHLKTSGLRAPDFQYFAWLNGTFIGPLPVRVPGVPSMVIDNRVLSVKELAALYGSAHVFLSPTLGEGFNLPAVESLGTGLPTILSLHTAALDYFSADIGFPLTSFYQVPFWREERGITAEASVAAGIPPDYYGSAPEEGAIIAALEEVYHGYDEALARGRRASEKMRQEFTWEIAARKFLSVAERYL
jgi:glycosyltransferase involved in cell wall biosynthesis